MFLKVIILTCLTVLSSTETRNQQTSKYAVSSQSFHRNDVPFSYKYSAIHVYTTVKPVHRTRPIGVNQREKSYTLQYAPLHPPKPTGTNQPSNQISPNVYKLKHQERRKEHLEPKSTPERNLESTNKQFIPGHNIELLQAVNQSSGHNTVYRDSNEHFEYKKPNFLPHYLLNQENPSNTTTDSSTNIWVSTTEIPSYLYALIARKKLRSHLLKDDDIPDIEDTNIPHPKAHRLHLNIARQYGVAQIIPSDHILDPSKYDPQSQLFKYLSQPLKNHQSIKKTVLYPVQDRNKNFLTNAS